MLRTDELIVDSFAGGGGASEGIKMALGRDPDLAVNHDAEALAMHAANHPGTKHVSKHIWNICPLQEVGSRKIGLLWASPDCKHFSKAKGGRPVSRNIRDLAWVVVRWAKQKAPRVIVLENVEEFQEWGPLTAAGLPDPDRKGEYFRRYVADLRRLGYVVEWKELRASDYGAPTIRKRLFLIARNDGVPIQWPTPTHGAPQGPAVIAGLKLPYRTAAEIIDWSLPCPSIFLTRAQGRAIGVNRPLAPATMARIAKGVKRFVLETAAPFIVPITHVGDSRVYNIEEPVRTLTTAHRGEQALVAPTLIQTGYGERPGQSPRAPGLDVPLGTAVAGGVKHALVAAFLAQHNTDMVGHHPAKPMSTIVQKGCTQAVVSAGLINMKGSDQRTAAIDAPAPAQCAQGNHIAEVRAFLLKYYGSAVGQRADEPAHTSTSKARLGLVMVHGEPYQIADIGMRMLSPRELFRAQGFPDNYIIDPIINGQKLTKTAQIRMCGNSVCPPLAAAIVRANFAEGLARKRGRKIAISPLFEKEAA